MPVATALTACGIETRWHIFTKDFAITVATALTACGIETQINIIKKQLKYKLQQRLPLAVLKLEMSYIWKLIHLKLQQRLPLAVLKRHQTNSRNSSRSVATALTACGIETIHIFYLTHHNNQSCNSAYRLRY